MPTFFGKLEARVRQVDSLLCVGLDPHPEDLEEPGAPAALEHCLRIIEATAGSAAAFKPNSAFFELYGAAGMAALGAVIAAVPPGIPVILDAKRGDIASTARAYARAAFETLGADAITLSPYLGEDALAPFLEDPERGVFLLCKTSNPGSGDIQDLPVTGGGQVFERVARLAADWNRNGNLGLVAGATHPEALERTRTAAPELWILAPGVGTQGGDLRAALRAGLRADGMGLLLPVSRQISRAENPETMAEQLRLAINQERQAFWAEDQAKSLPAHLASLADGLLAAGCVKFGQFTLKSGKLSPVYLDLRRLAGYPQLLDAVARAYTALLQRLAFDCLAALPYAALPIGTAVSLRGGWRMVYPRKEAKEYGTKAAVEGVFAAGEKAVVIDDLATTGGSKFEAIEKLVAAGLQVEDVVVLIDRQSGASQALGSAGYHLHAVFTLSRLLDYWEGRGAVSASQAETVRAFIASSGGE